VIAYLVDIYRHRCPYYYGTSSLGPPLSWTSLGRHARHQRGLSERVTGC